MKNKTSRKYIFGFIFAALGILFGGQIAAAQTCDITWRKVDNPRVISGTITIPANQTVCVEPGAVVQFASDGAIDLFGSIVGAGTSAERITFTGQNVSPNQISVAGTLDLQFADIGIQIAMSQGGSFLSRNCNFGLRGTLTSFSSISSGSGAPFVSIENAVFDSNNSTFQSQNASITAAGWTAILRNVTFRNNAYFNLFNSYLFVDNIVSQTSAYEGLTFGQDILQPLYLNNLNITNSARAGLKFINGNYFIGENVVIQNTEYPVAGAGGLVAGSQLPATGNRNNWVEVSAACCGQIFAPVGVPYVMQAFNGGVTFLPGVQIKARPNFSFNSEGGTLRVLGLPGAPVTIDPLFPGQKWRGGQFVSPGDRMEYVTLDGSQLGIVDAGFAQATYYIDNSILRNHDTAISTPGFLQGNLFANNGTALDAADGPFEASGRTNPNLFENNTIAVATFASNPDVRYNWWNSPSGPTSPQNPGGTGDVITGNSKFQPFRTARTDLTDHPPVVRMPTVPYPNALGPGQGLLDAGRKVALTWTASDDRQIVKQKILFSPSGNVKDNFTIIADNLPAAQKSFELLIPSVGFQPSGSPAFVRVVATDDKRQEGWDEWNVLVPSGELTGDLTITSNVGGQTFRGGEFLDPLTWTTTVPSGTFFQVFLLLDGDRKAVSVSSGNSTGGFSSFRMPMVSTDSARFAVVASISLNRQKWFFSQPFAIRPDPRFVDAAPQISVSSPTAGQQFSVGNAIPIQWTASDDESIRQFNIQASTDGGRTWVQIAENLPPTATNYNWQPSFRGSLNDVRVRVVAVDRRFQNSSDGANRVFSVAAPSNAAPTVQVTFPSNNASFASGKSIFIAANANDSDGAIQRVEFYATNDYLGQKGLPSTTLIGSDATAPYQIGWNYPSAQGYTITAKAIDNRNAATISAPINVTVNPGNPAPLPINPPELDAPNDGQNFPANLNITLRAVPGTGNRPIVRVDFYNGTTLIGSDTTAPYEIVWNNVPQGRYAIFARTIANNGAEATSKPADISVGVSQPTRRALYDFDGDGKADISVFRPSDGVWYLNQSTGGFAGVQFGLSIDKLAPADYDGDGKTDIAVFRDGVWYWLNSSNGSFNARQFGVASDIPVPADYTGDGRAELAVYRGGFWYTLNLADNQFQAVQFGIASDKPVPADFDGDGKTDIAVVRQGGGVSTWYILGTNRGFYGLQFGADTDKLVPADYDGDGKADVAVYRNGFWYILGSTQGFYGVQFGFASDVPVAADYDGDGKTDIAVYRDGFWYLLRSQQGFGAVQFGTTNDQPIPAAYVR